ncbi:response regulator [Agrobacterium deltaense]|uniref:response regulator n=1 Tax=Rhizobium sp. ZX09 TaxID=2291939 RepID=UPI001A98FE06|nr:response regulator [Rhizobium sp. ZX09]
MRILVVEDDENKRREVHEFLRSNYPADELMFGSSLVAGLREAKRSSPDLVILDMTLPNYEARGMELDGRMHPFGGKEFLRQIARTSASCKVIVLTQFESFGEAPNVTRLADLDAELKSKYSKHYVGSVYYHASIDEWAKNLNSMIQGLKIQ